MSKAAWALGGLLVVTNGVWIAREMSRAVDDSAAQTAPRGGGPARQVPPVEPRVGTPREARAARPVAVAPPAAQAPTPETKPTPAPSPPKVPSREEFVRRQQLMNEWRSALTQVADQSKRDTAYAALRAALDGDDETALAAALYTVILTSKLTVDHAGIHESLVRRTDHADPQLRSQAWAALLQFDPRPEDLARLRAAYATWDTPTRVANVNLLGWWEKGTMSDEMAAVIGPLLDDPKLTREVVGELQGYRQKMPDAILDRLIAYARKGEDEAHHATHFVLRGYAAPTRPVLDFLFDRAEQDMTAIEGLRWNVPKEERAYAVTRLRKLFEARSDPYERTKLLELTGWAGDETARPWLQELAADGRQTESIRASATGALKLLDRPRK